MCGRLNPGRNPISQTKAELFPGFQTNFSESLEVYENKIIILGIFFLCRGSCFLFINL